MKKSDLIKVIREIVKQELKKELPNALAQVFAQMMGQAQRPEVHSINTVRYLPKSEPPVPQPETEKDEVDEMVSLKAQLSEMFNGEAPVKRTQPVARPQQKQFTKNPVLNEVLNQTRGFSSNERMAMRAGGGGGLAMSPGVAMAAASYGGGAAVSETGVGQMMDESEVGFMRGVPTMPGASGPVLTELPTHAQTLREGQEGGSAPLEGLPVDSALDLKNHPALPDSIKGILSRDYRSLVRAMDKKK